VLKSLTLVGNSFGAEHFRWIDNNQNSNVQVFKSSTTGKAGGLKDPEPLEAVENLEPPKGDYC
jgi:hypothetical protein